MKVMVYTIPIKGLLRNLCAAALTFSIAKIVIKVDNCKLFHDFNTFVTLCISMRYKKFL